MWPDLELWAGAECSVVRIGDGYVDQLDRTGHASRPGDLDRLASLGSKAVRFPVLWERTAPRGLASADWAWADVGLTRLRELGIRPVVGLVHHGSGPHGTSITSETFAAGLADFAGAVARRYPWVTAFTPVNEPLTTARFSALYGHWYPHARCARSAVQALLQQCEATRRAMDAIREVTPGAELVQTEDVGTVFSTARLEYQARFENERRFASLDLLFGRIDGGHPLYAFLREHGADEARLRDFVRRPCPPDTVGINYYVTSDRFLDEARQRYAPATWGGNAFERYADVEAVRVAGSGIVGHRGVLDLVWNRYRTPVALTEVHLGASSADQVLWFAEAWSAAVAARRAGVDVRAVTTWAAFGAYDWNSLLTRVAGHYEPGAFDVTDGTAQETVLARYIRALAHGTAKYPPVGRGWWRNPSRVLALPAMLPTHAAG